MTQSIRKIYTFQKYLLLPLVICVQKFNTKNTPETYKKSLYLSTCTCLPIGTKFCGGFSYSKKRSYCKTLSYCKKICRGFPSSPCKPATIFSQFFFFKKNNAFFVCIYKLLSKLLKIRTSPWQAKKNPKKNYLAGSSLAKETATTRLSLLAQECPCHQITSSSSMQQPNSK